MNDKEKALLTTTSGTRSNNCRYITISDNVPEHWDDLIRVAQSSYNSFWYIRHDKDSDTLPHLHLVCFDKAGTSLKAHCERFSSIVPSNMVCKVKAPRAMLRYLIHKDQPEKFQYDKGLVQTNHPSYFASAIDDIQVSAKFDDFVKLTRKEITPSEYIERYKYEINSLNFYQQQSVYKNIFQSYGLFDK